MAILGFTPSYLHYLADIHWFAHVHGGLMSAWLLLFITQSSLAAFGSLRLHRTLGLGGIYGLLLPLFLFDLVSGGRIHRVTWIGITALFAGHVAVNLLWGAPLWHQFAYGLFHTLR